MTGLSGNLALEDGFRKTESACFLQPSSVGFQNDIGPWQCLEERIGYSKNKITAQYLILVNEALAAVLDGFKQQWIQTVFEDVFR